MSASHFSSNPAAVKSRARRSSWTAGPAVLPVPRRPFAGRGRPDPLLPAEPLHTVLAGPMPGPLEFVRDEPVAELGIISMDIDDRVQQVRGPPVAIADRAA